MNVNEHRDMQFWKMYVQGTLPSGERDAAETHLQYCDHCLAAYVQAVEEAEEPLQAPDASEFDERVLQAIRLEGRRMQQRDTPGQGYFPQEPSLEPPQKPSPQEPLQIQPPNQASEPYMPESQGHGLPKRLEPDASIRPSPGKPARSAASRTVFAHPLFHYVVAACITILLMSAGMFDRLIEQSDDWRNVGPRISLSERWTEQAANALADMQTKIKEGTRYEP